MAGQQGFLSREVDEADKLQSACMHGNDLILTGRPASRTDGRVAKGLERVYMSAF